MVRFKNLEVEGFGSLISKTTFNLDQQGLNIIRGKVGSGKTSIPSALFWTIFGQTLKGSKSSVLTWPEIRPTGYAGCKTVLTFDVNDIEYKLIRCKDFKRQIRVGDQKMKGANKLLLIQGDKPLHSEKGRIQLQKEIEKLIGYSPDLFKNSIVFGQKMKRIIEETGPNKKKVFEEAFEATFIKQAAENTDLEKKDLEKVLRDLQYQEDFNSDKLINKRENLKEINSLLENSKEITKQYKERIKELKAEQDSIRDLERIEPGDLDKKLNKVKTKYREAKEHNQNISRAKEKVRDLKEGIKELKELLNRKGKKCYTCGSRLQPDNYQKMQDKLNKDLDKLRAELKVVKKEAKVEKIDTEKLDNKIQKLNTEIHKIASHNQGIAKEKNRIPVIQLQIDKLQKSLDELNLKENQKKAKTLKSEIETLKLTVKDIVKKIKKVNRSIEIKQWLLKDPLSNNGLKAYLFNELLNNVNAQLMKYSDILGFRIEFGIDLSTRNKEFYQIIMLDNILIPYDDLSGGQKQLVDTSVAFAIHDVVSSIKPSNLVFLDEPFESLGVDEIEIIAELVEEKAKDKSLFLITHHNSFAPLNANEILVKRDKNKNTIIS